MSTILFTCLSHLISIGLTLTIVISIAAMFIGIPHCRRVVLVARATTQIGQEHLAKYLAVCAGFPQCTDNDNWRTFLPAARQLVQDHYDHRSTCSASNNTLSIQ